MDLLLFALWVFLPAGLANASPVLANKIPYLRDFKTPLDFGKHHRGKRIFGDNKTWRGLLFGILIAILTVWIQQSIYKQSAWLQASLDFDYAALSPVIFGFLLGAGALLGDAAESFFKRRMNIAAGTSWFPFDQLDYIIGGLLLASLSVTFSRQQSLVIILVWFAVHVISVYIGFLLNLRNEPI